MKKAFNIDLLSKTEDGTYFIIKINNDTLEGQKKYYGLINEMDEFPFRIITQFRISGNSNEGAIKLLELQKKGELFEFNLDEYLDEFGNEKAKNTKPHSAKFYISTISYDFNSDPCAWDCDLKLYQSYTI